jgi:hypothetical protein
MERIVWQSEGHQRVLDFHVTATGTESSVQAEANGEESIDLFCGGGAAGLDFCCWEYTKADLDDAPG